jgi:hypothetical protein
VGSSFPYSQFLPEFGQCRAVQIDVDGRFIGMRYPCEINLVADAGHHSRAGRRRGPGRVRQSRFQSQGAGVPAVQKELVASDPGLPFSSQPDGCAGKGAGAMRIPRVVIAGVAVATTLTGMSVVGCSSHSTSSSPTSAPAMTARPPLNDYTTLLIKASDINAPEPFTAGPPVKNPNGQQGATTTFTDQDHSHAIIDTIQIMLDHAAAANALDSAKAVQSESLNGKPVPLDVGVGGTTVSGISPDRSKGVTMLLFTEGKAFVTLEFDGPKEMLAPLDFVTEVGQKQDAAIKKGLGG